MKKYNLLIPLTMTFFTALIGMFIFEALKQFLHAEITVWESHSYTIAFSTVLATVGAFFIIRRREALLQKLNQENTDRKRVEETLREKQKDLQKMAEELKNSVQALDTLFAISQTLNQTLDLDLILNYTLDKLKNVFKVDAGLIP